MEKAISNLKSFVLSGKSTDLLENEIANNIDESVKENDFFFLEFNMLKRIIGKCDLISSSTIKTIINGVLSVYGENGLSILKHIECGNIGENAVELLGELEKISIIRELVGTIRYNQFLKNKSDSTGPSSNSSNELGFDPNSKVAITNLLNRISELQDENNKLSEHIKDLEINDKEVAVDWERLYTEEVKKRNIIKQELEDVKQKYTKLSESIRRKIPVMREFSKVEMNFVVNIVKKCDSEKLLEVVSNDPSLVYIRNENTKDKRTLLCMAAEKDWSDGVKILLDAGEGVEGFANIPDGTDWTPLMYACLSGSMQSAEMLIAKGANLEAKNNGGCSALTVAASNGQTEAVKLLLSKGANIEDTGINGWTPLYAACSTGQLDVAKLLVSKGANVNARDIKGKSILEAADERGLTKIVSFLRSKGAV